MKEKKVQPPDYFSTRTKTLWKSILKEFELAPESIEILRVACENLDLADQARELLRVFGVLVDGKKNPAQDAVKLHDSLYLRAMKQLGLDVVAPHSGVTPGRRE